MVEVWNMADDFNMLDTVKAALGITSDYLDNTIALYIAEVNEYLADAGVPASVIGTQRTAGVVARGVADLWNYGGASGVLSPYFYERVIQLATAAAANAEGVAQDG